jgi:tRNA G10  N-methylase Trm11
MLNEYLANHVYIVKVKTLAEKALGNVQHSEIKNVDLLLSDARELCFRNSSIDTIVSGKNT